MAFETTICEECPTPIQWQQLRKHYLFLINTALDVRDAKLKEKDATIELIGEFASSLRAFYLADDDDKISVRQYKKMASRVKRAATAVSKSMDASSVMVRMDQKFGGAT